MQIERSYSLTLSPLEKESLKAITNQCGVVDDETLREVEIFIEDKLNKAFGLGFNEAERIASNTEQKLSPMTQG